MPTPAPRLGSLRPAFTDLPPTLLPHAIQAAAPRPDRRTSALGALTVYLAAAAGVILLGHEAPRPVLPPYGRIGPIMVLQPEPAARPTQARAVVATRDPLPPVKPATPDRDQVPDSAPPRLDCTDHSRDGARAATDAERQAGRVDPLSAGGDRGSAAPGPAVIQELSSNPPRVLHAETPQYPTMARATRVQGPVELLMTIDEGGVPIQVQVLSGHPAFHTEAERVARHWRFEAATVEGRAVQARFRLTILFRLA